MAFAQERGDIFTEGLAWRVLGRVAAAQRPGTSEEIDRCMRRSRELLEAGGCYVEAARTLVEWGKLGLSRSDANANERANASDRLKDAARIFEVMQLTWEVDRIRPLLADPPTV
jgi:hypothetical protein